ncbi:MAG: hypothetical protein SVV80_03235 [Planctomycetota bacterium]|nr:hypothetical protein [Planctomycetota bacterium]
MAIKRKKSDSAKTKTRDLKYSRKAAGFNVAISIVVATVLLIVVNIISNKKSYRCDMETLGHYGLSDTAGKILGQIDQPVRLTSIYTSTKQDRKPQEYLPRLRDMMSEIARVKSGVTIVNVTSDRDKAEVLARLRRLLDEASVDHREVIKEFQRLDGKHGPQYEVLVRQWAEYPSGGWLEQFGMPKAVENAMGATRKQLRETAMELRRDLSVAALPDFPGMVRQIEDTLEKLQNTLKQISGRLRSLSTVPEKAKKQRQGLTTAAGKVQTALAKASSGIGRANSPLPRDPQKVIKSFAVDIRAAADSAQLTATQLDQFTGNGYVHNARSWRLGGVSLPILYRRLSGDINNIADQAEGLVRLTDKVDIQQQFVAEVRRVILQYLEASGRVRTAVDTLMDELTKLDEPTKKIFARAKQDNYLQAQIKPLNELLDQAGNVKPLPEHLTELIEKIGQDNIVLIEIGEKTGVVDFEEVWPLAAGQQMGQVDEDGNNKRVFQGDSAICAKMLSMTAEQFAEVVLTYFEDIPPRHLWQQQPPVVGSIVSLQLETLRQRLEKANLKVTEWNVARQPGPTASRDIPQVLLILPPPEPSPMPPGMGGQRPRWSPDEVAKIRKVIAKSTPAVFLAGYLFPQYMGRITMPAYYGLGDYLQNDWGIDVKIALRVIQASPDPLNPGEFKLPIHTWRHLPLSAFTDHPVGMPLKARRLYWLNVCPITTVSDNKSGAVINDILTVPEGGGETWAVSDINAFIRKVEQRESLQADPNSGDLLPPFAVAVEASKQIEGKQARIIVLAAGESFTDYYLQNPVIRFGEDGTIVPEPPPIADVDLLVNSIYHLAGRDEYIGAGPIIVEPIEQIKSGTMLGVKILCGLAWPMLMFAIGIVVMIVRKQ